MFTIDLTLNGEITSYFDEAKTKIKSIFNYQNNLLHGLVRRYNEDGSLLYQGEFKEGREINTFYINNPNTTLNFTASGDGELLFSRFDNIGILGITYYTSSSIHGIPVLAATFTAYPDNMIEGRVESSDNHIATLKRNALNNSNIFKVIGLSKNEWVDLNMNIGYLTSTPDTDIKAIHIQNKNYTVENTYFGKTYIKK